MQEELLHNAISKMITATKMHRQLLDGHVDSIGIYRTQHRILMILDKNGELPSQKELSRRLSITPAAVTGALKKLIKEGYIEKTIGSDNRFNEIKITELGKETVKKSKACFDIIDRSLFNNFTDEELELYVAFLDKIINNIKFSFEREDTKE